MWSWSLGLCSTQTLCGHLQDAVSWAHSGQFVSPAKCLQSGVPAATWQDKGKLASWWQGRLQWSFPQATKPSNFLVIFPLVNIFLNIILHIQAILYSSPTDEDKANHCSDRTLPSGLEVWAPVVPPCLISPSVQYSSVLITDVKSSNAVTIR